MKYKIKVIILIIAIIITSILIYTVKYGNYRLTYSKIKKHNYYHSLTIMDLYELDNAKLILTVNNNLKFFVKPEKNDVSYYILELLKNNMISFKGDELKVISDLKDYELPNDYNKIDIRPGDIILIGNSLIISNEYINNYNGIKIGKIKDVSEEEIIKILSNITEVSLELIPM